MVDVNLQIQAVEEWFVATEDAIKRSDSASLRRARDRLLEVAHEDSLLQPFVVRYLYRSAVFAASGWVPSEALAFHASMRATTELLLRKLKDSKQATRHS